MINDLDLAGRTDLTVPLRDTVQKMWERGSIDMPHPFLFRKLEKDTMEAVASHAASLLKPLPETDGNSGGAGESMALPESAAASIVPERLVLTTALPTTGRRDYDSPGYFVLQRESDRSFSLHITLRMHGMGDLEALRTTLILRGDPTIERDEHVIVGARRMDEVGVVRRSYDIEALNLPCRMTRQFTFHSAVEMDCTFTLRDKESADLFASGLRAMSYEEGGPAAQEFEQKVYRHGPKEIVERAAIGASVDGPDAVEFRAKHSIKRADLIHAIREVRLQYEELCRRPGMTFNRLVDEGRTYWDRVAAFLGIATKPKLP